MYRPSLTMLHVTPQVCGDKNCGKRRCNKKCAGLKCGDAMCGQLCKKICCGRECGDHHCGHPKNGLTLRRKHNQHGSTITAYKSSDFRYVDWRGSEGERRGGVSGGAWQGPYNDIF